MSASSRATSTAPSRSTRSCSATPIDRVEWRGEHAANVARLMGRPPGLELDAVFFRIPHTNAIFELVHFRGIEQATVVAGNTDIGATHFGFAVEDIEATVARLGLELSGTPMDLPIGPYRGGRSVYLKDPDGANIQLMQLAGRPRADARPASRETRPNDPQAGARRCGRRRAVSLEPGDGPGQGLDVRVGHDQQRVGQPAVGHDVDEVGRLEDLGDLGAVDDHRVAAAGVLAHEPVDLALRADVDAAGRLLEDEHARALHDRRRDGDLLLVAARQRADRQVDRGRLDPELVAQLVRDAQHPPRTQRDRRRS